MQLAAGFVFLVVDKMFFHTVETPWDLAWTLDPQPVGIPLYSYCRYLTGPKRHVGNESCLAMVSFSLMLM